MRQIRVRQVLFLRHRRRKLAVAASLVACLVAATAVPSSASTASSAATGAVIRFDDAGGKPDLGSIAAARQDALSHSNRSRLVDLSTLELADDLGSAEVIIELFSDVSIELGSSGILTTAEDGSSVWEATTTDAAATISLDGGEARGTIYSDGNTYLVEPVAGSVHLIAEEGREFEGDEAPTPPRPSQSALGGGEDFGTIAQDAANGDETVTIRVLNVFDSAASAYFDDNNAGNGGASADTVREIDAWTAQSNSYLSNSGVNFRFESAGVEPVSYTAGSNTAQTILNHLTNTSDGFLDEVHDRRDAVGADLVAFITGPRPDVCGIAWLTSWPANSQSARYGFSMTAASCSSLTYAHELGHNLGAGHGTPNGTGIFSYANGYRDDALAYRTIMSYNSSSCTGGYCQRLPYYSTPDVLYNGNRSLGSATQNNARVLNETGATVAGFRGAPINTPSAPGMPTAVADDEVASVSWTAPSSTGGATITTYSVTSTPGGHTCTTAGALSCNVTGLTNGVGYRFSVVASNLAGPGPASALSAEVTPFVITCAGTKATIVGTTGDDILEGTPQRDVIVGLSGNDSIYGFAGNDLICAGSGDDNVYSGSGSDVAYGNGGRDDVRGWTGIDTLSGGTGADVVHGGDGDDDLLGAAGKDDLRGQKGNDALDGGRDSDRCNGGAGRDSRTRCERN